MFKSELARLVLNEQYSDLDTDWLGLLSFDADSGEITTEDNEKMTKAFVRGLIAAGVVDLALLDDIGF